LLLSSIVLKLRAGKTHFENRIAGAAELEAALRGTLQKEMAFVIPLNEDTTPNEYDTSINQKVIERFGVVVAVASDESQRDKTGITAYDSLHNTRAELFRCLLGWLIPGAEDLVSYGGGRLLQFDRSYLWYQYEFVTTFLIDEDDGVPLGETNWLDTIRAEYEIMPSANLPYNGSLPVELFTPDMTTLVSFTSNPAIEGDFDRGFNAESFDVYQG